MILVKNLIEILKTYPPDAEVSAYEGEGVGLRIVVETDTYEGKGVGLRIVHTEKFAWINAHPDRKEDVQREEEWRLK